MEKENLIERITVDPGVMVGKPTIRGEDFEVYPISNENVRNMARAERLRR